MKVVNNNPAQMLQQSERSSISSTAQQANTREDIPGFQDRLSAGIESVAKTQNDAAEMARNFELGTENDLAKVMVGQQVSSLAFQLTLNVRNKALSAYKDIMNMPV